MLVRTIYAHDDEETMRLKTQIIIRELQHGTKISYPIQDFATGMKFAEVLKAEDTENKLVHIYVWHHYIDIEANDHGLQFACSIVPCAT